MTASELILQLQSIPAHTKIVIRGYESGYNDILKLKPVKIKLNPDEAWYLGVYDDSTDSDAIEAVDLFGENTNTEV